MPLKFELSDGKDGSLDFDTEDAVTGMLLLIGGVAPPRARRRFDLGRAATGADVLAAASGVDAQRLKPLTLLSGGIYTEEDYLAQFEEAWEVEEYGRDAKKVVARNKAAWQQPAVLLDAVDLATSALGDLALAKQLFPDDQWRDATEALESLRKAVKQAIARGAAEVCVEFGE